MAVKKQPDKKDFLSNIIYFSIITGFLLICIYQKLQTDIEAGEYQSSLIRISLVFIASLAATWCFTSPLALNKIRNLRGAIVIILFIGVLFYPLISQYSYLSKSIKETKATITKSYPAKTKKLVELVKQFPKEYKKHLDKHFDLPKFFVHFDALLKIYALGVSPNNNVAVGKNGFYFEGWGARKVEKGIVENFDNIADYMGQIPFSVTALRTWKKTLEERKYWLKEQGVEFVFVLAPTKALVYPEYLPTNLQNARITNSTTRYEQLTNYLQKASDIHFIDVLPSLLKAKQARSYPLLFYKTDFHWNFYGAFIAYQAIIDQLKIFLPDFTFAHPELSEFELSINEHWAHHRFVNMIGLPVSLHNNEHYITMVPKQGGRYDTAQDIPAKGIYDIYPPKRQITKKDGKSLTIRMILNPGAPVRSILLLGDSFFEKCVYFFSADAQRVLNHRTIVNFPHEIIRYEKPDIVIQEILNMFILRPPPKNPPFFEMSYLRGKFADNSAGMLIKQEAKAFTPFSSESKTGFQVALPSLSPPVKEEVRIARLRLNTREKTKITIGLFTANNHQLSIIEKEITENNSTIYFEFPYPQQLENLIISSNDTSSAFTPVSLEVRSDYNYH